MVVDKKQAEAEQFRMIPVKYRGARLAGKVQFTLEDYRRGLLNECEALHNIENSLTAYNASMNGGADSEAS